MFRIFTGTVKGYEHKKNRDGEVVGLLLQVAITSEKDIQTVEYFTQPGQDDNPAIDSAVTVFSVGEAYKIAIACNDGVAAAMKSGEKKLYSLDGLGSVVAFINLLSTGDIEIQGNNDFAVRYNALNTALQSMIIAINAETAKIAAALPVYGGTRSPVAQSFTPAKIDEVKVI